MSNIVTLAALFLGIAVGYSLRARSARCEIFSRSHYDDLLYEKTTLSVKLEMAQHDRAEVVRRLEAGKLESDARLENMTSKYSSLQERSLAAEASGKSLETQYKLLEMQTKEQPERLTHEFRNIANTIFEDISTKFSVRSRKQIGDLIDPMHQRLEEFKKLMVESFIVQGQQQHTLKAEIERIVLMNHEMRSQTESLTKALRGDFKAQGNWGEVMLERILEASGLQRGADYVLQAVDMALVDEHGARQQPDVIVKLPDDRHIIVDAKVTLVSYDRYCHETDESLKELHRKDFLHSIKGHVNTLEQKRYQHNEKLNSPDFVLMFIPIEGAYSFAVQQDRELHSYAWGKKIVLVCPATLFATLRTIASLWHIEKQNRNVQSIATQSGALYDKFVGFVEDLNAIGKQVTKLQDTYESALNKLVTGRGKLVGRVERLRVLGAKTRKSLSEEIGGINHAEDLFGDQAMEHI